MNLLSTEHLRDCQLLATRATARKPVRHLDLAEIARAAAASPPVAEQRSVPRPKSAPSVSPMPIGDGFRSWIRPAPTARSEARSE